MKKQNYWSKIKNWLFAEEDELDTSVPQQETSWKNASAGRLPEYTVKKPEPVKAAEKKEVPLPEDDSWEMEPVRMLHYYPKEKAPRPEKKKKPEEKKAIPTTRRPGSVRKTPGEPSREKKAASVPERPEKKKERPAVYGSGPFKAQEIPSPVRGLKLEQERREEYRRKLAEESREEQQKLEIPFSSREEKKADIEASSTAGEEKSSPEAESFPEVPAPSRAEVKDPETEKTAVEMPVSSGEEKHLKADPAFTEVTEKKKPRPDEKYRAEAETASIKKDPEVREPETGERVTLQADESKESIVAAPGKPLPVQIKESKLQRTEKEAEESAVPADGYEVIRSEDFTGRKEEGKELKPAPVERAPKKEEQQNRNIRKAETAAEPVKKKQEKHKQSPKYSKPFNVMMTQTDRARIKRAPQRTASEYMFPALNLLEMPPQVDTGREEWAREMSWKLNETFSYFRLNAEVVTYTSGPSVTRFEVQPEPGVKISKIVQLTDDLKRSLAATEIRLEAPIPGKTTVGIEVPNPSASPVMLRTVLQDKNFRDAPSPLTVALGVDISGNAVVTDITSMPHGLIAGTTGSGKSVCVNSMLTSILYKSTPEEVRMLLIDPKMVELAPFNNVPHLAAPVITDTKEATAALKWAVEEMERRYQLFAESGARDLSRYNARTEEKLPKLLIVVDELADLMMVAPSEVEDAICRIAQKARACGIHLLVATQRPSVDVITGLIKANIPSRIAFSVSSSADSRTILDSGGAERLLGKGDMLFHPNSSPKPVRIQGTFVTDDEIDRVIEFVGRNEKPAPLFNSKELKEVENSSPDDRLFNEAREFVIEKQTASTSLLQRHFQVGYNRAARLIDELEAHGVVSPANGSKPRDVYTGIDKVT